MASTKETQQPSLQRRLDAARQAATDAKAVLDSLESRLETAIRAEQYDEAHSIKRQLPDVDEAWAIAAAELQALEIQADALERQRAQRDAVEAAARRKLQAGKNLADATERASQGMDELAQLKAELVASIDACQAVIVRAYRVEQLVQQARADAHQAQVDLGEASPGVFIPAPNLVSSLVERSQTLTAIRHGQALPGVR
jgi:hypothetical protein